MKKRVYLMVAFLAAAALTACRHAAASTPEPTPEPTATAEPTPPPTDAPDSLEQLLAGLTLEQKVGQLFLVRPDALDATQSPEQINDARAEGVTAVTPELCAMLERYPVGGVALFTKNITDPDQLRTLIGDLQAASAVPLFVGVDEEGGAVARLANHPAFHLPTYESATAVGKQGEQAALEMGRTIGGYLKEYGLNLDFAPVADVNTNPNNPVIGTRAFSNDAQQVAVLAPAMARGLQEQGILPTLKHFPGHGDTAQDSHYGMATVNKTEAELAACEWVPYGYGTQPPLTPGSYLVMVGHISLPLVTGTDIPATLCPEIVTGVLKEQLYDPLIITDSLAMEAITDRYTTGQSAVLALRAGCDILLMPSSLAEAFDAVLAAVQSGEISEQRLDASVRKILQYKMDYGIITL